MLMGYGLLYVAAALTLVSMISYLRSAWPTLLEGITAGTGNSDEEARKPVIED